jgi:hypothetical protein
MRSPVDPTEEQKQKRRPKAQVDTNPDFPRAFPLIISIETNRSSGIANA